MTGSHTSSHNDDAQVRLRSANVTTRNAVPLHIKPWLSDAPHVGTFANFRDAVAEASFRAAITQRRYRVCYEPNNCWWQISEGFKL
jgi:hypothetical protein